MKIRLGLQHDVERLIKALGAQAVPKGPSRYSTLPREYQERRNARKRELRAMKNRVTA
jgi:hypothetical protein